MELCVIVLTKRFNVRVLLQNVEVRRSLWLLFTPIFDTVLFIFYHGRCLKHQILTVWNFIILNFHPFFFFSHFLCQIKGKIVLQTTLATALSSEERRLVNVLECPVKLIIFSNSVGDKLNPSCETN
jgi:hypothetical protein